MDKVMPDNVFLNDILSQPDALLSAIQHTDLHPLEPIARSVGQAEYTRVILTGMGASFYGVYPAWLHLARAGIAAIWVDASELVNSAYALITPHTLLWIVSQSGRSAEITALLQLLSGHPPAALLVTVNDLDSPLAQAGATLSVPCVILPLFAQTEQSVSTRTYVNTLAVTQLAALVLKGEDPGSAFIDLAFTIQEMEAYLSHWQEHLEAIGRAVGAPDQLALIGRGSSMASVYTGALFLAEAARFQASAFQAGEFRHGPLELVSNQFYALLFSGPPETRSLNWRLWQKLRDLRAKVNWIGLAYGPSTIEDELKMPDWRGVGLPLAEILPVQLLCVHLAFEKGFEPGQFRHIEKVTIQE